VRREPVEAPAWWTGRGLFLWQQGPRLSLCAAAAWDKRPALTTLWGDNGSNRDVRRFAKRGVLEPRSFAILADNLGARLAGAWRRLGNGTYNLFECIAVLAKRSAC
jgi:hypothetical protein